MNPFWASTAIPDSRTLDHQCRVVMETLRAGPPDPAKPVMREAVHCLFSLARTSLPDVRANLFWPEVHRELSRRTGIELDPQLITRTFRHWLSESYPAQIDWETHHKYVGLVFEQAGIGKDRNRIIARFLRQLVDDPEFASDAPAKEVVNGALRRLEARLRESRSDELSDVSALRPVLTRAGIAVAEFAAFIRDLPDRWKLQKMSWDKVKALWHEASGVDPDTLTPSARDVLASIVSELVSVLTRDQAYKRVAAGSIRLRLPGGNLVDRAVGGAAGLPLGPAEVIASAGSLTVQLVDDESLTSSVLAELERDVWHRSGDLWYRTSDQPFALRDTQGRRYKAVPLYLGHSPVRARQVGFYWGIQCREEGRLPDLCEPGRAGTDEVVTPGISVRTRLVVDRSGAASIWVNGFRSRVPDGQARLRFNDVVVWQGHVEDGSPLAWKAFRRAIEAADVEKGIRVVLEGANANFDRRISLGQLRQPVLLAVGSRLVPPYGTVSLDGSEMIWCFFEAGGTRPNLSSGSLGNPEEVNLAGRSLVRVAVNCFTGGAESMALSFRGREWTFVRSVSFSVTVELPDKAIIDGVEVTAVSSARLLGAGQRVTALVLPSAPWKQTPAHLSLHVVTSASTTIPVPVTALSPSGDGGGST